MKLSLATRMFLGQAVVLVAFGAVAIFSVAELRRSQQEMRLVSQGYLQLSQQIAAIETFHTNQARDTERLAGEQSLETRRALIRLSRLYFPPLMAQRIAEARARTDAIHAMDPGGEAEVIGALETRLEALAQRSNRYTAEAETVFRALEVQSPDGPEVQQQMESLKSLEGSIGREIRSLRALLESRLRQRVQLAQVRERRSGIAIIGLSILSICLGLFATWVSARNLRPVQALIAGATRIARGEYPARLGVKGEDEIATLARAFDAMATSLQEREAELKAQGEALRRAEQLAAIGRLSAQVAHEVRNPLSSINLNVELLDEAVGQADFPDPETAKEARELLAAVTREVDRLTGVTERYLGMSRIPEPELAPEDLHALLGGVLEFVRGELDRDGVEVELSLEAPHSAILADEGQLRQVFLNLLRNAREAMPEGGRLILSTTSGPDHLELRVSDTGVGLHPSTQDELFEPFVTTKRGGTGLGLAVSRQILLAHRGSIRAETRTGGGTTFVVTLPLLSSRGSLPVAS
ncbi:MAG TPA: ATP-binding protein [Myxococcaceae bacterium]|nr:ATP-binding protein [Myxococcaceae bacterium]